MLAVTGLTCVKGKRQLFSGLNLTLEAGALLHVQGHNGSGKTTLLRALCGLLQPQNGDITWRGCSIYKIWEDFCREVLYIGHLEGIKPDLTASENLQIAAVLSGQNLSITANWQILARIGLAGREDLPTRVLSQGQKKRVALARLFISKARLWILDEPLVGLDVAAVQLILGTIAAHLTNGGLVVLTTHQDLTLTAVKIQHLQLGRL